MNLHVGSGLLEILALTKLIFLVTELAQEYHNICPRQTSCSSDSTSRNHMDVLC